MCFILACEVAFEDTKVPVENVIGEVGGGFKVTPWSSADLNGHLHSFTFFHLISYKILNNKLIMKKGIFVIEP